MKRFVFPLTVLFLFLPFVSKASAYWLDMTGSGKLNEPVQIQVCYGYIDEYSIRHRDTGKELELTGGFRISVVDEKGKLIPVSIYQKGDCWEGIFTPAQNGIYRILGVNDSHPVVDRSKTGGKNVRPIDYLCAAYRVGNGNLGLMQKPAQFLDIITDKKRDLVTVKAFKDEQPETGKAKLRVFNPENWEKELEADDQGATFFKPTMKGLYIIREDWEDIQAGTYKGVSYTGIRYRCNYCLLVP